MSFMRNFTKGLREAGTGFFQGANAALPAAVENWNQRTETKRKETRESALAAFKGAMEAGDVPGMIKAEKDYPNFAKLFASLKGSNKADLQNKSLEVTALLNSLEEQFRDPKLTQEQFDILSPQYTKLKADLSGYTNRLKGHGADLFSPAAAPTLTPAAPGAAPATGMAPRPPVAPPAALGGLGEAAAPSSGITLPTAPPAPIGLAPSAAAPAPLGFMAQARANIEKRDTAMKTIEGIRTGAEIPEEIAESAFATIVSDPESREAYRQVTFAAGLDARAARQALLAAQKASQRLSTAQEQNVRLSGDVLRSSLTKDAYNNPAAASPEMLKALGITPPMVEYYIAHEAEIRQADPPTIARLAPEYIAHVYGPNADPNRTDSLLQHWKSQSYANLTDTKNGVLDSINRMLMEQLLPISLDDTKTRSAMIRNAEVLLEAAEQKYKRADVPDDLDKIFKVVAEIPDVAAQVADLKRRALLLKPGSEAVFWVTASKNFSTEVVAKAKAPVIPPADPVTTLPWETGGKYIGETARTAKGLAKSTAGAIAAPFSEMSKGFSRGYAEPQPVPAGR